MIKNVLLIVQNNSFPFDKRVYKEAMTLSRNGYKVHVICPVSERDKIKKENVDGIEVRRYNNLLSDGSAYGFVKEYLNSLIKIYFLSILLFITNKINFVHVANPPDFFWPLALISKVFGIKFIYDQHDLAPEMFRLKYNNDSVYNFLRLNERLTIKYSDGIICVNEAFKKRLNSQVGLNGQQCIILPNGPSSSFIPIRNDILLNKYSGKKVILYIGLMSVNDNIEIIVEAARKIVYERKRTDCHFILLGDGDVRPAMEALVQKYKLERHIEFTGIVEYSKVQEYLYISSLGIAPDQPNGLNEYLTHIKILEYMKAGKPFVSFNLEETMRISAESGLYASDINDFVEKILCLTDNNDLNKKLGEIGEKIIDANFIWEESEKILINLYKKVDKQSNSKKINKSFNTQRVNI